MLVNGTPTLASKTLPKDLPEITTLLPLPVFKLLGDLSWTPASGFATYPCVRSHGFTWMNHLFPVRRKNG